MSANDNFVGTRPVSEAHQFDVGALEAWLKQHMPGFAGPLSVEMFKGGQSNPTFKLITPGASYVMRAKPAALGPCCGTRVRRDAWPVRHGGPGGADACAL